MYIPSSFFGSQGACISASVSTISGSGLITTGTFVSASISWSYVQFETADYTDPTYTEFTASLNILSGSTGQAKLLIVGAGGAGGTGNITPSINDYAAGGGGGGGVVYYNNFPLSSGSYEIAVGGATTQISVQAVGNNGRNSYIKLPNNIIYTPFTSSFLTAYGGGGGGTGQLDASAPFTCQSTNGSAGPTTGGIGIYTQQCGSRDATNTIYTTLNGITLGPQGFKGGNITAGAGSTMAATGGGGAATTGSNLSANDLDTGLYASNGGNGLQFNLTGTSFYVSPGGGGQAAGDTGTTGTGGNTYGRGGQGERDGTTSQINYGFGGIVIIAWPICLYTSSIVPEPIVLPNIITGSLTAWNYWSTYTASATSWYDSSGNGNTATIYDATDAGIATLDSLTIISQSVKFNMNKLSYGTYTMNATPSSSYSLQFYGQFNNEVSNSKYPLLSNQDSFWSVNLVPAGVEDTSSNNYIVWGTNNNQFNQFLVPFTGSAIFSGSNLLTINVNSTARTTEVYLNTNLIATGSSTSSFGHPKAFNDGLGLNEIGWSTLTKSGTGALIPPNTLYANVKSIAIYGKELTQSEITQNYNALTS